MAAGTSSRAWNVHASSSSCPATVQDGVKRPSGQYKNPATSSCSSGNATSKGGPVGATHVPGTNLNDPSIQSQHVRCPVEKLLYKNLQPRRIIGRRAGRPTCSPFCSPTHAWPGAAGPKRPAGHPASLLESKSSGAFTMSNYRAAPAVVTSTRRQCLLHAAPASTHA
jgi:hypothetical protein